MREKEKVEVFLSIKFYLEWDLVFMGLFGELKVDC